jgi:Thiol:disulfide interchange protein DsbD, N-terminal
MNTIKNRFIIPVIALLFLVTTVVAQENPLDKVKWDFSIEQNGCEATVVAKATIVKHWHVYGAHLPEGSFTLPTELNLEDSPNYKLIGKVTEPKPEISHDDIIDEDIYLHSGVVEFKQKIEITSAKDFVLKGKYSFQTCDDKVCLPPFDGEFTVKVKGCSTTETNVEENNMVEEVKESEFESVNGDEAKGKDGADYVKVNEKWYKVPDGNSLAFYKKYLMMGGVSNE